MNIILNHKHDVEIQSQLNIANRLARTRTIDIREELLKRFESFDC